MRVLNACYMKFSTGLYLAGLRITNPVHKKSQWSKPRSMYISHAWV